MKKHTGKIIFIYMLLYFAVNLLFLDRYPFMHSDESWLSGLTRAMMSDGPAATEPFFDLLPRYPHAIKTLFHIMQMPFILVFGYDLFAVRLLSLLFGTASLYLFYKLALLLSKSDVKALLITVLLSVDVQFIYASHFARQDIIIAFGILAVIYYIIRNSDNWSYKKDIIAGIITGVFIGVHPNSLIIALCAGSIYLYYIFAKTIKIKNLLMLVLTVSLFAGVFVGISLMMNSNFFSDFMKYGSDLGVGLPLADKIRAFPQYYQKLFLQVSGTYYTPLIKLELIAFAAGAIASVIYAVKKRDILRLLLPVIAVNAGFIMIGRYSQPGVILIFPLCYLIAFCVSDALVKKFRLIPVLLAGAALLTSAAFAVAPYLNNDYRDYLAGIKSAVPADSRVLANLNCEYAFLDGALLDYRNLGYLGENMKFEEYIASRGIEYIIYPEELDFIYENRPVWNILYGNLYPYYEDMQRFLDERCTKTHEFYSPYAMRIAGYMYQKNWSVRIYRVDREDSD